MNDVDGLTGLSVQQQQQNPNQLGQQGHGGDPTGGGGGAGQGHQGGGGDMMGGGHHPGQASATGAAAGYHHQHNTGGGYSHHHQDYRHHHQQAATNHHYQAYDGWNQQYQQQAQHHDIQQQIQHQQYPQQQRPHQHLEQQYHHYQNSATTGHHPGHTDYNHHQQWATNTSTATTTTTQQQQVLVDVEVEPKGKNAKLEQSDDEVSSQEGRGRKSSGKKTKTSAVSKKRKSTKASKSQSNVAAAASSNNQSSTAKSGKLKTKAAREKPNKTSGQASSTTGGGLEESVESVRASMGEGCDCAESTCFEGLCPEAVYRHRLDIDELTKAEHHMYLLGLTMACLNQNEETNRHDVRKRQKSKYRFMGRDVCLGAFLYLEHTTLHQLKSVRKHIRDHGVTPKEHGNHRKRPHNVFSLDIYQAATKFLQDFFERHKSTKESNSAKQKGLIFLPDKITCKKIHSEYSDYCLSQDPNTKTMGYTSFRHFVSDQFPNLRFINEKTSQENSLKPAKVGNHTG